jgi:hypothetical protein
MKTTSDPSWWALAAATLLLSVSLARPKTNSSVGSAGAPGGAGDPIEAADDAVSPWQPAPPVASPQTHAGLRVQEHSQAIIDAVHESQAPAPQRLLAWMHAALPPGWENTFVLHDVMVASGALTDMARLLSFASADGLEARPRDALRDEALRIQAIADDIARRWLAWKHPMLGDDGIEHLLAEPNREVLPLLGEYNMLAVDDLIRILRVPVLPKD